MPPKLRQNAAPTAVAAPTASAGEEVPITTTEFKELTVCAATVVACDPLRQDHCIDNPDYVAPVEVVEEVVDENGSTVPTFQTRL